MDYDTIVMLHKSDAAFLALRKDWLPLAVSYLYDTFKRKHVVTLAQDVFRERLDAYLDYFNTMLTDAYSHNADYYMDRWSREDDLIRIRNCEDGYIVQLSPHAERLIGWFEEMTNRGMVGTESRLRNIISLLDEIVMRSTEDVEARLRQLYERRDRIDAEIARIEETRQVDGFTDVQIREHLSHISSLTGQLLRDFSLVEERFREMARSIQQAQLDPQAKRGDILASALNANEQLEVSDEGRSFGAFYALLTHPQERENFDRLINAIFTLPRLASFLDDNLILQRLTSHLLDAGERVNQSNQRLTEHLRRVVDTRSVTESRRVQMLSREIVHLVSQLGEDIVPMFNTRQTFMTLEGVPMIDLPLERPLFDPPMQVRARERPIPASTRIDVEALAALYDTFYIDETALLENIKRLLMSRAEVSLVELVRSYPIQLGMSEIIGYLLIAMREPQHSVDATIADEIPVTTREGVTKTVIGPRMIFRRTSQNEPTLRTMGVATMKTLFKENIGFRLKRLELFNWGTFNGQIWQMTSEGQTAVLTGANGSGKSTVVDALLTLFVEGRQRNYNLASGANTSRERTEKTYVLGQYSRSRGENAIDARANTLRGHESHSVILAVFYDVAQDRTVTLAQVLWISNTDRVEKRHYVATCELSIERHFPQRHITSHDLPQEVKSFGNIFKDYIAEARKALGLGGRHKALDLFNETVSVKDIASLNTFVRDHMLDKGNPDERVEALRGQYRELNDAHNAIQRAGRQLAILAPLVKAGKDYRRYNDQIRRYDAAKSLVPFYVAEQTLNLLETESSKVGRRKEAQVSRRQSVDLELDNLRAALQDVEIAIAQDSIGQMKREIEVKLPALQSEISALQRAAKQYDNNARSLELPVYRDEADFYENRDRADKMIKNANEAIRLLEDERSERQLSQREFVVRGKALEEEVMYLRDHLSNIPAQVARIRDEISAALNISVERLPFVGELLKVRDEETAWEGTLERLLHNFAQDLIVPEALYPQVSAYVNTNNLKGRLVYQRVDPTRRYNHATEQRESIMAHDKLEIRQETPYQDWLAATLIRKFNYSCSESLSAFQQAERAITLQGQIKHSRSHHEKDDRHPIDNRRNYVLGWNNRDKLRQLETELDDLHRSLKVLEDQISQIKDILTRRQADIRALENLLSVHEFAEIDWRIKQTEVDRLVTQLASLDDSHLRDLERQRDGLRGQVAEKRHERDKINSEITTLDNRLKVFDTQMRIATKQLEALTDEHRALWERVGDVIKALDDKLLLVENIQTRANELEVSLQRSIANFKGYQNQFAAIILDAMNNFRRNFPDESVSLTADIAALTAFENIAARLEKDDLPKYEDRFKQMLNRTVSQGVRVFSATLSEQERTIDRSIEELNDSLKQVDYGGGSTIRLIAERNTDPEINAFRRELVACMPDVGDNSPEELERAYNRIKALIEHFDQDPNWMRRVIDVRRWRMFAAEQIDAQGKTVDYYSDSSGKSGGQKAKLAYTILASAIAHQYGLQDLRPGDRSFRFVVIDEAFSKLDDENARFAMKLFDQLGLQLLVVTPMQQLHVIEDYVHAYHITENNAEGSYSRLHNLTIHEYQRVFHAQGKLS